MSTTSVMDQPARKEPLVMEELPMTQPTPAMHQLPVMEKPEVMEVPSPITH
jgi:hypothetical protein